MPHGDGTGPRGFGPMTGRAKEKCIIRIPDSNAEPVKGFLGLSAKSDFIEGGCGVINEIP